MSRHNGSAASGLPIRAQWACVADRTASSEGGIPGDRIEEAAPALFTSVRPGVLSSSDEAHETHRPRLKRFVLTVATLIQNQAGQLPEWLEFHMLKQFGFADLGLSQTPGLADPLQLIHQQPSSYMHACILCNSSRSDPVSGQRRALLHVRPELD